jgi:CRISPR-associated protein Cmr4
MDGRVSMDRALLFLYAETPVHVGADTSRGGLDLPIQREITTGFPIIKAESLKGALRERFRPDQEADRDRWVRIFGDEPPKDGVRAGTLRPGTLRVHEAQLVAFPAPALARTFVWVTSPLAQARLERKARLAGVRIATEGTTAPALIPDDAACVGVGSATGQFVIGPYAVSTSQDPAFGSWARQLADVAFPTLGELDFFKDKLAADLFACSDDLLGAISRDCAPVVARVQLGTGEQDSSPRKTVQHGPFYSEYLPAETLLAALLECDDSGHLDYLTSTLNDGVLRIGGDETLGKGLLWCRILSPSTTGQHPAGQAVAGADR